MDLSTILTAQNIVSAVTIVVVVHVILVTCAYLIYLERKISAYIQDRIGPNRVGFDFGLPFMPKFLKRCLGLGQSLADGLKFLLKEDYTPKNVDKVLFTLAPALIIIPALIGFIIVPWGGTWECPSFTIPLLNHDVQGGPVQVMGADISIGLVFLLAITALGVYGVTLGGYAGNNKFSFLGGLRATAQMISYEIPLGLALLAVLLLVGTLSPTGIIRYQQEHGWLIFAQPITAIIFFLAIMAEANRAPFDNAEAEQELVGGYHTEYSSMRFALFFLAEYAGMMTSCAIFAVVFLGGYQLLPFIDDGLTGATATGFGAVLAKFAVLMGKTVTLIAFQMVIRWTIPRLRFDQIMMVAWQGVIPIMLVVVVLNSVMIYLGLRGTIPMLLANIALAAVIIALQPLLPKPTNRRIPLYGSRFSPMPGELVRTGPTDATALEDRPYEGTVGAAHVAPR